VNLAAADESVLAAAQRMQGARVGTLVVLNEGREPIGLVTDRDLVTRVIVGGKDPQTTPVGTIMTRDLRTVGEDSPIESALALMRAGGFRRLPVVDGQGKLAGILSLDDVLALLAEELAQIGGVLERQTPRASPPVIRR
jgi:CBS domain-containing protein